MIIFDLDDTLYDNERLSRRNTQLTKKWIQQELGLNKAELEELYRNLPKKYPNPLNGVTSLGLSPEGYHENVFGKIEPSKYLSERIELKKELEKLDEEQAIVSFAPETYCRRVLDVLGIEEFFQQVISASQFNSSKKQAYEEIKNPELVIGDNFKADLRPAIEIGIDIIHVSKNCKISQNHTCCEDVIQALQLIKQR